MLWQLLRYVLDHKGMTGCKSEWEINKELGQVYSFPDLIQTGMDFVQANSYMFNQYKKSEVLGKMIEKWQFS